MRTAVYEKCARWCERAAGEACPLLDSISNRLEVSNVFFGTESGDMAGYEAFQLVVGLFQHFHLRERDGPEVTASELGVESTSMH